MTLRTRFLLYVIGLIAGSFLLYAGALSWTQREFLEQDQEKANRDESGRWALLCEQSVLSKDEITLVHYLRELRGSDEVRWASFLALDGRVIMHTDLSKKNSAADDPAGRWALGVEQRAQRRFRAADGLDVLVYAEPVRRGNERIGVSVLAFDASRQKKRMASALAASVRRFAGVTVLCLLAGVAGAIFVARGLVWPLQELTGAVRRLGGGDWSARPSVSRRDEIGELAVAFSEMSHRLGRLDELKDEFVSTVSHDLRNPLGAITMAARYLLFPPNPISDEARKQILGTVLLSTARLRTMVDNILDAAKIKEGRLDSLRDPFSLGKVLGELHALYRPQAEEFGRRFVLDVPADLPPAVGDEAQTYRILSNLLSNAFKFTSAGDRIGLSAKPVSGNRIAVEVSDEGPGIAPGNIPQLFQRFHTLPSAESSIRKQQGTGLGLAIAKALALAQGGDLTVTSEKNHGTTFQLLLPQAGHA